MLAWVCIALVCFSCGKRPSAEDPASHRDQAQKNKPSESEIADEVARFWKAGQHDESRRKAQQGLDLFGSKDSYARWQFTLYRDLGPEQGDKALLTLPLPAYVKGTEAEVEILWKRAKVGGRQRRLGLLAQARSAAETLGNHSYLAWTDLRHANVLLNVEPKQPAEAEILLESVVKQGAAMRDTSLTPMALVSLCGALSSLDRYDESIARCNQVADWLAKKPNDQIRADTENNLGWSLLKVGNDQEALQHLMNAAALYKRLKNPKQILAFRNQAAVYVSQGRFTEATGKLDEAFTAAEGDAQAQAAISADRAEVFVSNRRYDLATDAYVDARRLTGYNGTLRSQDDAHIVFVDALIRQTRNDPTAEAGYQRVFEAKIARSSMRLAAALQRAEILTLAKRYTTAEEQYRKAAEFLESMRAKLQDDESKLSYFDTPRQLFEQYVDLLVSQNKKDQALAVADYSRARLLSDYQNDPQVKRLNLLALQTQLAKVHGLALFYWIGTQHAYLWTIDSKRVDCKELQHPNRLQALAQQYSEAILARQMSAEARQAGLDLRNAMLGPVSKDLTPDRRVFIVMDSKLGLINPESLQGFHAEWLLQELTISVAPSLSLLQRTRNSTGPAPAAKLLAIGDAIPMPGFEKLQHAGTELNSISGAYPSTVIRGQDATPASYAHADPRQFTMIHFTAHGESKANNPLDSAVVLSPDPETTAFKLYAREIFKQPIGARLVTISACKSAISRTYQSEGVVGLAWAFLRAGAGQVVAGLWNANDESTSELMKVFYAKMHDGLTPAEALRAAKLKIMEGYKHPYNWAVFEIFAGYVEP